MEERELVLAEKSFAGGMNDVANTIYTSMKADNPEGKAKLFNVMNNPDKKIADMIGQTIVVKDLFIEDIELVDEFTGELVSAPRIVVIDTKGVSYQAVSVGVLSAFKKLIALFGKPTWENGIALQVKQIKKGKNNILTFAIPE